MIRNTGTYAPSTTLGELVQAFVPHPLPPSDPPISADRFVDLNRQAELALARLSGVSGLVPSVDWLLYSAIRKEALLTSQIEGTQATLTDLFNEEAGLATSNTEDVKEVTNYLRALRFVRDNLQSAQGISRSTTSASPASAPTVRGSPGDLFSLKVWRPLLRMPNAASLPLPPW